MKPNIRKSANVDRYLRLVQEFPLKPIRSDAELNAAIARLDVLLDLESLRPGEKDYLDVLSTLIAEYEEEHLAFEPVSDAAMLKHLLESQATTQADVARKTGIAHSTISDVLAGKRPLNRRQIAKLCAHFKVDAGLFHFSE